MLRFFTPVLTRLYALMAVVLVVFFTIPAAQSTRWHHERLFARLESGDSKVRLQAARDLANCGGQEQLMRGLQSHSRDVQIAVASALFDLWVASAGEEARQTLYSAFDSVEHRDFRRALFLLTFITQLHPDFAEAWNRRAVLQMNLGRFDYALADARRAVVLNPSHFAAWQEIAVCQMRRGNYEAAIRALRTSLRLVPYDANGRRLLRRCFELRQQPQHLPAPRWAEMV
ncbi:MAG: tetratricopeptide repeat protein [Verrucomicrobia bacterium]|nr:tetratricopeptide repeat protein [Verrucomicrobiota bacterium]